MNDDDDAVMVPVTAAPSRAVAGGAGARSRAGPPCGAGTGAGLGGRPAFGSSGRGAADILHF